MTAVPTPDPAVQIARLALPVHTTAPDGTARDVIRALRERYDLVPKGSAPLWRDLARRADGGDGGAAMQLVGAVLAALDAVPE
jgi:hypothetical protein